MAPQGISYSVSTTFFKSVSEVNTPYFFVLFTALSLVEYGAT